ncbi:MAG: hypothetical protein KGI89_16495 [Euryarchaeota archaeon]|nr:hypothetical protein [Euryarchaeota archaeon]MDE2046564.1 hypothetical protein [Thermoplasmata archaeon]
MSENYATTRRTPSAPLPYPTDRNPDDDSWVDRVADEVGDLLRQHGLDMEMVVFYDPVDEQLHAVGFDGNPARYFRSLESDCVPDVDVPPSSTPS